MTIIRYVYDHQNQNQTAREFRNIPVVKSKKPTRLVTPRRLPPLNPNPSPPSGASPSNSQARKGDPTKSPNIPKALSLTRQQPGYRTQSEIKLQYERQHAFEVSLEQMLMEVENGEDWLKEEKKQKKVGKEEQPTTSGWQKIWYKRLG